MERSILKTTGVTVVATAAEGDLEGVGTLRYDGDKIYQWCLNGNPAALVAGYVVGFTPASELTYSVDHLLTADLAFMAGVVMGAIPIGGYGWVQRRGYYATAWILGHANHAIGSALIGVDQQFYATYSTPLGTAPIYPSYLIALSAYTTTAAAAKPVYINCI